MDKTTKETNQVKQILKNMKHYSIKNGCEFTNQKFDKMNLFPNEPRDLINYVFEENGFILSFNVSFIKKSVYISEFSEDADIKKEISFKEFIKFQSNFLNENYKN